METSRGGESVRCAFFLRTESVGLLVEVRVQSLGLDTTTNSPVVILQELGGERVLPIWIGPSEARAIAMRMAEMEFSRPLTHDLIVSVVKGLAAPCARSSSAAWKTAPTTRSSSCSATAT